MKCLTNTESKHLIFQNFLYCFRISFHLDFRSLTWDTHKVSFFKCAFDYSFACVPVHANVWTCRLVLIEKLSFGLATPMERQTCTILFFAVGLFSIKFINILNVSMMLGLLMSLVLTVSLTSCRADFVGAIFCSIILHDCRHIL